MSAPPASYLAAKASGATAMCLCWRLERLDGAVLGFTDHDRDLAFDGTTYSAGGALEASEASTAVGLAPDDAEAAGALRDAGLTEADIAAGLYDGATVQVFEVDWRDPAVRALREVYRVGAIRRGRLGFVAEFRSVTAELDIEKADRLGPCPVKLGSARCGVDLTASAFRGSATVLAGSVADGGRRFDAAPLASFAGGWFAGGVLTWTSGANVGAAFDVRAHRLAGTVATLELWRKPRAAVADGDGFTITAGCDKALATCRDKFANAVNYQGTPHLPREDANARYAVDGDEGLDGGSRFA